MEPFKRIDAVAVPIDGADTDTDQILPARFMHKRRFNYGRYFFHDLRTDSTGTPRPGFVLNHPAFANAQIVVGDTNFGCGSSREQAVHTIVDYGIRAVIAPSFGDIFHTNCLKNGVLPIILPDETVAELRDSLRRTPGLRMIVDLEREEVVDPDGRHHALSTDPFGRSCLLAGRDEIDYTLTLLDRVRAFEANCR